MTEKEIGEFIKYHSSSSKELNNDALHGTFFSMFALRIFIWGITKYAEGTQDFDLPGAKRQSKLSVKKTSSEIMKGLSSYPLFHQTSKITNRAEHVIRCELLSGSNLANSLDYYARVNKIAPEYYLKMIEPVAKEYGDIENGVYKTTIIEAANSLSHYAPLIKLGAAYMQLKRAGEISEKILEDINVMQLMSALQQAAFDIVSYNIGASFYYAQAKSLGIKDLPSNISDIFSYPIDSTFDLSKQDMIHALSKIEQVFGNNSLGDFLKNLQNEMITVESENFTQILSAVLAKYQLSTDYKPVIDNNGHYEMYGVANVDYCFKFS
ncbi:TPA: hypothetical protein ACP9FK_002659 [Legionella anisa]